MATITDQMTEIYCFVDDYLKAHLQLHDWRVSPNNHPQFTDAEVLTIALMQGCLGVDNLKQSYKLIAENYRDAFPQLCCYTQWINRLHLLSPQIGALLSGHVRSQGRVGGALPGRFQADSAVSSSQACQSAAHER